MPKFELNILGCGSATSTLRHLPSCQVLNVRDNVMMIDCGEGAQLEMRRQKLKFSRLTNIFISHLHGDHCFGLPGLLSTLSLLQKSSSVTVHIFEDGADLLKRVMDYFCRDMSFDLRFNVITKEPRVIYEDDAITVRTFPLRHRVPTVGFVFEEKAKLRHVNSWAVKEYEVPQHFMNSLRQGMDYVTPGGVVIPNEQLTTEADASISYAYASDTTYSERVIRTRVPRERVLVYERGCGHHRLRPRLFSPRHSVRLPGLPPEEDGLWRTPACCVPSGRSCFPSWRRHCLTHRYRSHRKSE